MTEQTVTIKKAYVAIVDVLRNNKDALVSEVLTQIESLASAKTGAGGGKATVFHRDPDTNEVVAIKCYYHKLWMDPRVVEFGVKATSPTGLNNMCKDGVAKWTKQQRDGKNATAALLQRVATGNLAVSDIPNAEAEIAEETALILVREDTYGFETLEECLADSAERAQKES
jgi:hypothetical protein